MEKYYTERKLSDFLNLLELAIDAEDKRAIIVWYDINEGFSEINWAKCGGDTLRRYEELVKHGNYLLYER